MGKTEYSAIAVMGAMLFVISVTTMQWWQSFSTWGMLTGVLLLLSVYSVAMQLVTELFVPSVPAGLRLFTRGLLTVTEILIVGGAALTLLVFILSLFFSVFIADFSSWVTAFWGLSAGTALIASIVYVVTAASVNQDWEGRSFALPILGFALVGIPPWTETILALELMAIVGAILFVAGHVGGIKTIDAESASAA